MDIQAGAFDMDDTLLRSDRSISDYTVRVLRRCRERAPEDEHLTDKEMIRRIKRVDADRAKYYEMFSDTRWGAKEGYHLCVNTTGANIKALVPAIAQYARSWMDNNQK